MSETQRDREVSPTASRRKPFSNRTKLIGGGVITAAIVGFVFWFNPGKREEPEEKPPETRMAQSVSYPPPVSETALTASQPAAPSPRLPAPNPLSIANSMPGSPKQGKPEGVKMYSYAVAREDRPAEGERGQPRAAAGTTVAFKAATLPGGRAGKAMDLTYLMIPGVYHCVLDTAVQSDLPGPIQCHLDRDVLSPGHVVLMERGTVITGEYKNNIQRGQSRIFTMAATAITPYGVPVPLDSPMADGLGRAGLDGAIDNHLWERFGGGVLLSLVDNVFSVAQAALRSGNGNSYLNFNTSSASSVAEEVLRNTINVPPTITKNQGEDVTFFLRYPIDFSDAYSLRTR